MVSDVEVVAPIGLDELPSMSAAAMSLVELCDRPDVGLPELTTAVSIDPGLSARILRLANSAAYSRGNEITSVERAMMVLGLNVVKITALGVVVSSTVAGPSSLDAELEQQIWRQCLVEAVACRELAVVAGSRSTSEAFLAGLFDGMGRLLGALARPTTYGGLLAVEPWPTAEQERATLGLGSRELLLLALESWDIPQLYRHVLGHEGDGFDHSEVGELAAILTLSRNATRLLLGDPAMGGTSVAQAAEVLGVADAALDDIAVHLGAHVEDLAHTLDVELGSTIDHQTLLNQARNQMVATSLAMAADAVAQAREIQTLRTETDSLRHESLTDRLTGLPNRARFDDFLRSAVFDRITGKTLTGGLGIAIIDLDHFKALNDTHGHRAGDRVLQSVGERLRAITRTDELIARYGGEEFTLVAPVVTGPDGLAATAERIRQSIAELSIEADGVILRVTASVGAIAATTLSGESAGGALTEAADRLLYQAKHAGRNKVRVEWINGG